MQMKILTSEERDYFYHNYLLNDFHESEVKPLNLIEQLISNGNYQCIGFFKNKVPMGYAYLIKSNDDKVLFLDYFAVIKTHRSNGLGSIFIDHLKNTFKDKYTSLIAEVENPYYSENEKDKHNRNRRINFYLQNGFKITNICSRVKNDEYHIINIDFQQNSDETELFNYLKQIYISMSDYNFFTKHVKLRLIDN